MMALKNNPSSLFNLALQTVSKCLLNQWKNTYCTEYLIYAEEIKGIVGNIIPYTIYDYIFEAVVDLHTRYLQDRNRAYFYLISSLIGSLICSNQRKLCLSGLRHLGIALDEEIIYLQNILIKEIPSLTNLVEISLHTSGTDSTLPTCTDDLLNEIGKYCTQLKVLDISYNHTVTDIGLECILPSQFRNGCVKLVKLNLFECSVSIEGVADLLTRLPQLKFLGYRETGQSLLYLAKQNSEMNKLVLAHVNNLGVISRTCKDVGKLICNGNLVTALNTLCPKLNGLKVRITDSDVTLLQKLSTITILEMYYNVGTPASPSNGTVQYLNVCGTQLVSLSFVCDTFTTKYLKVVCEQCNNLKNLCIRCNTFCCDLEITNSDKRKCMLMSLEVFLFKVGWSRHEESRIPHSVVNYVLHKTNVLRELLFAMNNSLLCDSFVELLFSSIQTSKLKEVMIQVPYKFTASSSVNLTMSSVNFIMHLCPELEKLGNILLWDVSLEEFQDLKRQLKHTNSALDLVFSMKILTSL